MFFHPFRRTLFLVIGCGLLLSTASVAQIRKLYSNKELKQIEKASVALEQRRKVNYEKALRIARQLNHPIREVHPDGRVVMLRGINETGELIYAATESNAQAANATRTNSLYNGGILNLSLNGGSSQMNGKLGIWDGGRVLNTHREFGGRVRQGDNANSNDNHATHVSGTLVAQGINATARGMAFGANLLAFDFGNDDPEMSTASADLLVSNHSYGDLAGFVFNTNRSTANKWEWRGNLSVSSSEDYKFGFYDEGCSDWDRIAYNAPYYLIVKSAGNKRSETGPQAGAYYFLGSSTRDSSNVERSRNDSFDTLPTISNAKNILTVAAVNPMTNSPNSPADIRMSSFSSWGPTDDGRIKPDIAGVGVNLISTSSTSNESYATLSGTSMSSPQVSGSLFLLQELYSVLNDKQFMRAASLKGLAIHTAEEAGDAPGPDYRFGWGLLNAERAARVLLNTDRNHSLTERVLAQGGTYTQEVVASGKGPLVVTIAWTDPEADATPVTATNLNNRTPRLVNDLDVRVSDGTSTFLPWVLNPEQPSTAATRGDNIRDNVEQILIPNAVAGKRYTITIRHKGTLVRAPQAYSLVMSGIGGTAYCASAATNNADSKITKVVLGQINSTSPDGCASFTDLTNLSTDLEVGQTVPLEVSLGTCGVSNAKVLKVFVDWNGDGDFADANELVATSGVINGNDTYRTTFRVPSIVPGNSSRVRVVCVETSDPNAVSSCGNYAKGETQEFRVNFVRPETDISVSELVAPEPGFCSSSALRGVTVRFQNLGRNTLTNLPVQVEVLENNTRVALLSGTYTRNISTLGQDQFMLPGTFEAKPGATYTFRASISSPNDRDSSNDVLTVSRTASPLSAPASGNASLCTSSLQLSANNTAGTVYWYDAPTGGNLLGLGKASTTPRPTGSVVYAGLNDFAGTTGVPSRSTFASGGYNQFDPGVRITTRTPLVLESARLYIGNSGRLIFTVINETTGRTASRVALDVRATRNPAAPGALSADPNDSGAVYTLNLNIPEPGTYLIDIDYEDGATIFRNNNIPRNPYPIELPGVMSIIGNTATGQVEQFYYYFYDLKVKALGCPAPSRTPVTVVQGALSKSTVTAAEGTGLCPNGTLSLTTNAAAGSTYQWLRNGQALSGASSASLTVSQTGAYQVTVTEPGLCPSTSDSLRITQKNPALPQIQVRDNVLTSSAPNVIQWLRNGVPIPNAVGASLTVFQSGNYSVRAIVDGCEVQSGLQPVTITSLSSALPSEPSLSVYPNPSTAEGIRIEFKPNRQVQTVSAAIYNSLGVVVKQLTMQKDSDVFSAQIPGNELSLGTFFVVINDGQRVLNRKLTRTQ